MTSDIKDHYSSLLECMGAYRKAAVFETFLDLDLKNILQKPLTSEKIAQKLTLNSDACYRFLNASTYLGLVEKKDNQFTTAQNMPFYSKEASVVLFWLINNKIADKLEPVPLSLNQLMTTLPKHSSKMIEACNKFLLLSQDEEKNYLVPPSIKKYLISNSPDYLGHLIKHFEKIMFPMFSKQGLLCALRTGKSQWHTFFNKEVAHPFSLYKDDPELLEIFTNGMHQLNIDDDEIIVNNLKLHDVKTVLDIGGGSGAFILQLLKKFNSITHVDIYELSDAIPIMKKIFNQYAPKEQRVKYIPGSFLEETEKGNLSGLNSDQKYDLIILGWILHDWRDETNLKILNRLIHHLKPNASVIFVECILPENKISAICQSDLTMLLQTEGRERTFSEYKNLLALSGFRYVSTLKTETRRQAIIAKIS